MDQNIKTISNAVLRGLATSDQKEWPERVARAIAPGQDLSSVGQQFAQAFLTDPSVNPGIEHPLIRNAVRQCADGTRGARGILNEARRHAEAMAGQIKGSCAASAAARAALAAHGGNYESAISHAARLRDASQANNWRESVARIGDKFIALIEAAS